MAKSETEVQTTNSQEQVNGREFKASPELSSLYTEDNRVRDHFSPTNQYHRPVKHDAHYPPNPIVTFPETSVDTRWLGANHVPAPTINYEGRKTQWISETPREPSPWHNKYPPMSTTHNKINDEEINQFKGYWKWIPQEESKGYSKNDEYEGKVVHHLSAIPGYTEHHFNGHENTFSKFPTTKDRPYSFDSQETPIIFQQGGNSEGIKSDAVIWTTSETPPHLATTELNSKEINILAEKHKNILDHKFK